MTALGCERATVERVRKQFVEEGHEATLNPKPTTRIYERRLDGKAEGHLVAMAWGAPPEGRARWTLRLLADQMVVLGHVESVSHEAMRQTLKKKERARAVAEERLLFAGSAVERVCGCHGGRVGGLSSPV